MEDVRQPLDNPYLDADAKTLAAEVAQYRAIAADRAQRDREIQAKKVGGEGRTPYAQAQLGGLPGIPVVHARNVIIFFRVVSCFVV